MADRAPYIVPISTILQRPDLRPLSYDGALELFSRPLMHILVIPAKDGRGERTAAPRESRTSASCN
jgi:hypothetical protein